MAFYLQHVGRGLRIEEGKNRTIVIDNVGLYNYFGLPDADHNWQDYFIVQILYKKQDKFLIPYNFFIYLHSNNNIRSK